MRLAADRDAIVRKLERMRWNGKPQCPYCQSHKTRFLMNERRHRCYTCCSLFSVTVGTLFHGTRLSLKKWFDAIWLMEESREDPSCRAMAQLLGVNRNTACYMAMRIRKARLKESALLWAIREDIRNDRTNS